MVTTLRGHGWPDTRTGKFAMLRTAPQAPGYSERGAVGGRLHALVRRVPLKEMEYVSHMADIGE